MESPQTSKMRITCGGTSLPKVNCTPKNYKSSGVLGEELEFYKLHREASPSFRGGQDVLEIGWGDSPEPLNVEKKLELNRTPVTCKKKLEIKESPKSSIPLKRRNVRPSFSMPSKSIVDVAKYVAEVQELSKSIMKELNSKKIDENLLFQDEKLVCSNRFIECRSSPVRSLAKETSASSSSSQGKDPAFDSVIQNFINEEDDDWLSQALSSQDQKTPQKKGSFTKSKSENELSLPQLDKQISRNPNINNNNNNSFRRTSSFDLTKPQNSYNGNVTNTQYSVQEIERKRLEAKYRRERREIERKKLEAMKKLEMKKLRVIKA